ncbi:MAG TPA: hypothetical protein DDY20_10320 [Desulfobulbaceae bacterium]|nr:hypothetical protein [Desulfobulbaceae bacterium]
MELGKCSFVMMLLLAGILCLCLSPVEVRGADDPNEVGTVQSTGSLATQSEVKAQAVATVPGVTYYSVNYADFFPYSGTATKFVIPGSGTYSDGGSLIASTDLPHGSSIYDMTVWGGAGGYVVLRRANLGVYSWDTVAEVVLPDGAGIVSATVLLPSPILVDRGQASYHLQIFSTSAAKTILDVRIGYLKGTGTFNVIPNQEGGGAVIHLK